MSRKYSKNYSLIEKTHTENHPALMHKLEMSIAPDIVSDDSATAAWAEKFTNSSNTVFLQYKPNKKAIYLLKPLLQNVQIKVIGGNWCSDTRREVPRLIKILYYCDFNEENFEYYRVDKTKKALEKDFASTISVEKVPLIIVYKRNVEKGRIIETAVPTIEENLLAILQKQD